MNAEQKTDLINWAFGVPELTATQRLVLVSYVNFRCSDDPASREEIRNFTGLGRSTVDQAMRELKARGVLIKLDELDGGDCVTALEFEWICFERENELNQAAAKLARIKSAGGAK